MSECKKLRLSFLALGAFPLLALTLYAYAPGIPQIYLTTEELLSGSYSSAASRGSEFALWGRALVVCVALASLWIFAVRRTDNNWQLALAGVVLSIMIALPQWSLFIMSGSLSVASMVSIALLLAFALFSLRIVASLPAIAPPVLFLSLGLGLVSVVKTAGNVVLLSNPPLFVLENFAANEDSLDAQLALGLHLVSIGGEREARAHLMSAAAGLRERYQKEGDTDLVAACENVLLFADRLRSVPDQASAPSLGGHN